jgi:AmmeMemoRadiSam system protein B
MIRRPAVAGSFYEDDPEKLKRQISYCFTHPLGPGSYPLVSKEGPSNIYIVPHAGYMYSGPIAAHVYAELALATPPELVVILGPNHTGLGSYVAAFPSGEWETPLGSVPIDHETVRKLAVESEVIDLDERAHLYEHSIEVQLPFLQYVFGNNFKLVPIVIMMQTPEVAEYISEGLYRLLGSQKRILILASTDMNHYDPHEETLKKDQLAIEKILSLDYRGLYHAVQDSDVTMCGYGPTMTVMRLARKMGKRPILMKHATSGDTSGDKSSVVGYLTVKFID